MAGKGFPQRRFEGFVNLKESSSSPSRNLRSRDGIPIIWLNVEKFDENKPKLRTIVRDLLNIQFVGHANKKISSIEYVVPKSLMSSCWLYEF